MLLRCGATSATVKGPRNATVRGVFFWTLHSYFSRRPCFPEGGRSSFLAAPTASLGRHYNLPMMTPPELARQRLITLLDYCEEVSKLSDRAESNPLVLGGGFEASDGGSSQFVLHEDVLSRLSEVKSEHGSRCCFLGGQRGVNGENDSGPVWLRLHRPDSSEGRDSAAGKLLCSVYAALFSAHQEALREGRGAQVTAGVGILRWKRKADDKMIDHPLVTLPAELQLDTDGSLVVRMADGAQASLWSMPGVADCSQALRRIVRCLSHVPASPQAHRIGALAFARRARSRVSLPVSPSLPLFPPFLSSPLRFSRSARLLCVPTQHARAPNMQQEGAMDYVTAEHPNGILGVASPPAPADREAWAPLLKRAAYELAADGAYVDAPPKTTAKGALAGTPEARLRVHAGFALWTRQDAGELGIARDVTSLKEALRLLPAEELTAALARLAGVYGVPAVRPLPSVAEAPRGFFSRLFGLGGGKATNSAPAAPGASAAGASSAHAVGGRTPFLYFGLPSNAAQETVVERLASHGCAVLVGPPGTGKSQTIANVICHYLATGRRVLVTSKGEPATEVLRQKLPAGVRELAVSLGSADAAGYRRLEAAVENLANHVANADPSRLSAASEGLRRRLRVITSDMEAIEAAEERWAQPYFPTVEAAGGGMGSASHDDSAGGGGGGGGGGRGGIVGGGGGGGGSGGSLAAVPLHAEHLGVLGLTTNESATLTQLADIVVTVMRPDGVGAGPASSSLAAAAAEASASSSAAAAAAAPSSSFFSFRSPVASRVITSDSRAYFLADVEVNPLKPPPPQETIDQIRTLRRQCAEALVWGAGLRTRAAKTEDLKTPELRQMSELLVSRSKLEAAVLRNELPRIRNGRADEAQRLIDQLWNLSPLLGQLEAFVRASAAAALQAAQAAADAAEDGGSGGAAGGTGAASKKARKARLAAAKAEVEGLRAAGDRAPGEWLFALLRHADEPPAERALRAVVCAAQRLSALGTTVARSDSVTLPLLLKSQIDAAVAKALQSGGGEGGDDGSSGGAGAGGGGWSAIGDELPAVACEALAEITWRAHPDKRSYLGEIARKFGGAKRGAETLEGALATIMVNGRSPVSARDWLQVEQVLQLRIAASVFRHAWQSLGTYADPPPLPAHAAFKADDGLGAGGDPRSALLKNDTDLQERLLLGGARQPEQEEEEVEVGGWRRRRGRSRRSHRCWAAAAAAEATRSPRAERERARRRWPPPHRLRKAREGAVQAAAAEVVVVVGHGRRHERAAEARRPLPRRRPRRSLPSSFPAGPADRRWRLRRGCARSCSRHSRRATPAYRPPPASPAPPPARWTREPRATRVLPCSTWLGAARRTAMRCVSRSRRRSPSTAPPLPLRWRGGRRCSRSWIGATPHPNWAAEEGQAEEGQAEEGEAEEEAAEEEREGGRRRRRKQKRRQCALSDGQAAGGGGSAGFPRSVRG